MPIHNAACTDPAALDGVAAAGRTGGSGDEEEEPVTQAVKHDASKPRMDLIPPEAFFALGHVLGAGAAKYGDRNWELGLDQGRICAALLRHLAAWMARQDSDPDSGMPHSWHVLANAAFLVATDARKADAVDSRAIRAAIDGMARDWADSICGGPDPAAPKMCQACGGAGTIWRPGHAAWNPDLKAGYVPGEWLPCPGCGGKT